MPSNISCLKIEEQKVEQLSKEKDTYYVYIKQKYLLELCAKVVQSS